MEPTHSSQAENDSFEVVQEASSRPTGLISGRIVGRTRAVSRSMSPEESVSKVSYASTARSGVLERKFPALTLDFQASDEGAKLGSEVVADFIFQELGLQSTEILRLHGYKPGDTTVKVMNKEDVLIQDRFGTRKAYSRKYGNRQWLCKIRGGSDHSTLRFIKVPMGIPLDVLKNSIKAFATPVSEIKEEFFGKNVDPRLRSLCNGNFRVQVKIIGEIPEVIVVGTHRIRIWHKEQVLKCHICVSTTHFRANCNIRAERVEGKQTRERGEMDEDEEDGKVEQETTDPVEKGHEGIEQDEEKEHEGIEQDEEKEHEGIEQDEEKGHEGIEQDEEKEHEGIEQDEEKENQEEGNGKCKESEPKSREIESTVSSSGMVTGDKKHREIDLDRQNLATRITKRSRTPSPQPTSSDCHEQNENWQRVGPKNSVVKSTKKKHVVAPTMGTRNRPTKNH